MNPHGMDCQCPEHLGKSLDPAARTAMPQLIEEVEKLQSQIQCLESWNDLAKEKLSAFSDCLKRQEKEHTALKAEIQTFADAWNELEALQRENQSLRELLRQVQDYLKYPSPDQEPGLEWRIDAALREK